MAKSNFENLRVYQLAEQLADEIWSIVFGWEVFARDTVGNSLSKLPTVLELMSLRVPAEGLSSIIAGS